MIELSSSLSGKTFPLSGLEQKLKPLGYSIGGNWDYEHGSFDYKMDDKEGYLFLRLPFKAVNSELDSSGAVVELQQPFLLSHVYQDSVDPEGNIGNVTAAFNQFAEPKDKDGEFPEDYISLGQAHLHEVEKVLL